VNITTQRDVGQNIVCWLKRLYLANISTVHDDVSAVVLAQLNLHDRSNLRHHDRHRDAEVVTMVSERQRVVASASRYYALPLLFLQNRNDTGSRYETTISRQTEYMVRYYQRDKNCYDVL